MARRPVRGPLLAMAACLAALVVAGAFALNVTGARAQSSDTAISVVPPGDPVKEGDAPVTIAVSASNVKNLAAFEFLLLYDGDIFDYESYQKGDFLGSTGREVVCNEVSDTGAFKLNCVTLRQAPPLGPDGSGILATIQLKPKGSGTSELTLDKIKFSAADETATTIPVPVVNNSSVEVAASSGTNWLMWGLIIGAVAVVAIGAITFGVSRTRGGAS